jgi:hypothetical protein
MKCFFCSCEVVDTEGIGILDCPSKTHTARYVCSGSLKHPEVWYVHLRMDPFLIQWDLEIPETTVYSGPMYKESNFIMKLNEVLPYSIQEANQLLSRFHNMKVFL